MEQKCLLSDCKETNNILRYVQRQLTISLVNDRENWLVKLYEKWN